MEEEYWHRQRNNVLLAPQTTYLNAGSFSPLRRCVAEAVGALRYELASSPSDFHWRRTPTLLTAAREALATYLAVDPQNLLLLRNATFGINLVASALRLPAGSEILTSDHEYGAMLACWRRLAARDGLSLREIPLPGRLENPQQIIDVLAQGIGPKTRLLFFSHVTSPTGIVFPAKELCRLARDRGVYSVIDGAHAPGMLPVKPEEIDADFYAGNCHKWLMAPTGAGFLHVKSECREILEPLVTSWGWDYPAKFAFEDSGWGSSFWARNLEFQGTEDRCPLLVLPNVLEDRATIGESAIFERTHFLANYARSRLSDLGFMPASTWKAELCGSMVAVETPPVEPIRARNWLWQEHRIEAPFTTVGKRSLLRVSTAWFNTIAELDQIAGVMAVFPFSQLA